MKKLYFLYDPENGFETFETEEKRDAEAKASIESYLSDDEGWDELVEQIFTGVITHSANKVNVKKRPGDSELDENACDEEGMYWGDFEYTCNYELTKINQAEKDAAAEFINQLSEIHIIQRERK